MFKLESYITPIILSYVDKYVKNARAEKSQVSSYFPKKKHQVCGSSLHFYNQIFM